MADHRLAGRLIVAAAAIAALLALGPFAASAPAKLRVAVGTTTLTGKGSVGVAQANCPRGTSAVSGGFGQSPAASFPQSHYINVFSSHRKGARAWTVSGVQYYGSSPGTLTAYAYCSPEKAPKSVAKSFPLLAAPRYEAAAVATCPRGTQPISGGFKLPQPVPNGTSVFLTQMQIFGKHQWLVKGVRSSAPGTDGLVTAYAYCAKGKRPKAKTETVTTLTKISPAVPFAVDTDKCPKGTLPIAGGLRGPYSQVGADRGIPSVTDSLRIGRAWRVSSLAVGTVDDIPISFTAIVYCR